MVSFERVYELCRDKKGGKPLEIAFSQLEFSLLSRLARGNLLDICSKGCRARYLELAGGEGGSTASSEDRKTDPNGPIKWL